MSALAPPAGTLPMTPPCRCNVVESRENIYHQGMNEPAYYVAVFTTTSWRLFKEAGGTTAGFTSRAWNRVHKLIPGDYLLCYLVDVKLWIGLLRVTGEPYCGTKPPIWGADIFPARVKVQVIEELPEDAAVPARELVKQIPRLKDVDDKHAGAWGGFLRGSPRRWRAEDAWIVIDAIQRLGHLQNP